MFVLGAVVLAVTGGEALYADMGHFGAKAIRHAWMYVVLLMAGPELSWARCIGTEQSHGDR